MNNLPKVTLPENLPSLDIMNMANRRIEKAKQTFEEQEIEAKEDRYKRGGRRGKRIKQKRKYQHWNRSAAKKWGWK